MLQKEIEWSGMKRLVFSVKGFPRSSAGEKEHDEDGLTQNNH